ncbi:MAG: zinc ABC transporter substrate-binding protein [Elusimicrobia bacterium]|nr:zinc ABC transporter substrate-binding protein [Elusimicrobiota bacterium]
MKILSLSLFLFLSIPSYAKINIIASSQDLKSIAEYVGGEEVSVESLSPGGFDIHFIEPRPSMVFKLKKADMVVKIGLDLDMWTDSLINAAKNEKIFYGKEGYVDASAGIDIMQKPDKKIDGSSGDIHIFGNPHYWLNPENGKIIAKNIKLGLLRIKPEKKEYFEKRYSDFCRKIDDKMKVWKSDMSAFAGEKIITYHNSWIYFAQAFDLQVAANIEPKPGIPPNANHLSFLFELIKKEKIKIILVDNFYSLNTPKEIANKTGARLIVIPSSVAGENSASDYFSLFDVIIKKIKD